jgi:putative transposase
MARLPRFTLAGQVHLVALQCRAGQSMFVDDEDRRRYSVALLESSREHAVAVHAYALLDDQVLLLVSAPQPASLGQFMQAVGRRYVRPFNRRHARTGALWDGRFRSTVIDPASFLLECMRLIEQAPVRRGWVGQAGDWVWSSAAHHAGHKADSIVTEHVAYWQLGNTPFERQARHVRDLGLMLADRTVGELLAAARHGWPLGSAVFLRSLAEATERPVQRRPRGRPRQTPKPAATGSTELV